MFVRLPHAIVAVGLTISMLVCSVNGQRQGPIPAAKLDAPLAASPSRKMAVFAGGCFWGPQSVLERVKGVLKTTARYPGGTAATACLDLRVRPLAH